MEHDDTQGPSNAGARRTHLSDNVRSVVVTGLISASLLSVMYGVTLHRADEQQAQHRAELRHDPGPPEARVAAAGVTNLRHDTQDRPSGRAAIARAPDAGRIVRSSIAVRTPKRPRCW